MTQKSPLQKMSLPWKIFGFLLALVGIGSAALAGVAWYLSEPVSPNSQEVISFTVTPGKAVTFIAEDLYEQNLIRSPLAFRIMTRVYGIAPKIKAGTFELSPSMNVYDLATALTTEASVIRVTVKEGWRAGQIGDYLMETLPNFSVTDPDFQTECLEYEGFLFPETYYVSPNFTTKQMCELMRKQYGSVFTFDMRNRVAKNTGLSDEEAVILASILEREARNPDQMSLVAGILLNRLEIGMALQVDATLQYAKGYDSARKDWWPPAKPADKQINSPFNTYLYPGLPPAPISNPGKNALEAVANPTTTSALFYIHADDGKMYTAETYEEHQQNIARYLR